MKAIGPRWSATYLNNLSAPHLILKPKIIMKTYKTSLRKASLLSGLLFVTPALMLGASNSPEVVDQANTNERSNTDRDRDRTSRTNSSDRDSNRANRDRNTNRDRRNHEGMPLHRDFDEDIENSRVAERILSASPEELAKIRSLLERIENMDEEEKQKALTKIRENRRGFGDRRRAFDNMTPEQRESLRKMSPEERQKEMQRLHMERGERGDRRPGNDNMQRRGTDRSRPTTSRTRSGTPDQSNTNQNKNQQDSSGSQSK